MIHRWKDGDIFSRSATILESYWDMRTDRQTELLCQYRALHSWCGHTIKIEIKELKVEKLSFSRIQRCWLHVLMCLFMHYRERYKYRYKCTTWTTEHLLKAWRHIQHLQPETRKTRELSITFAGRCDVNNNITTLAHASCQCQPQRC